MAIENGHGKIPCCDTRIRNVYSWSCSIEMRPCRPQERKEGPPKSLDETLCRRLNSDYATRQKQRRPNLARPERSKDSRVTRGSAAGNIPESGQTGISYSIRDRRFHLSLPNYWSGRFCAD